MKQRLHNISRDHIVSGFYPSWTEYEMSASLRKDLLGELQPIRREITLNLSTPMLEQLRVFDGEKDLLDPLEYPGGFVPRWVKEGGFLRRLTGLFEVVWGANLGPEMD